MRYLHVLSWLVLTAPAAALAQGGGVLDLSSLAALESSAEETVSISLDSATMDLARSFLGQHVSEEEAALEIIEGLESFQVRVFEFSDDGAFSDADIAPIYDQLSGPNWSQVLRINEEDERVGAWVFRAGEAVEGIAIVVSESSEVVVVNIVGMIRLEDLQVLATSFGLPFLPVAPAGNP